MTEPLFHVIAAGSPAAGLEPAAVARQLEQQLKLTAEQAARLLGGKPVMVKRGVARATAEKYCAHLGALGLQVRIEPASTEPGVAAMPASDNPIPAGATPSPAMPADWPALTDFFSGISMPLPQRRSTRHLRRVFVSTALAAGIAVAYGILAVLGALALVLYTASFLYLLTAPPVLFSIPVFTVPWLLLAALNVLLWRPLLPLRDAPMQEPSLHAHLQPQLFHWISQLCELVAVPMPCELAIGVQTTSTVRMLDERGAFRRAGYRLSLSLPLLAAGSLRDNSALTAATLATQAEPALLRCRHLLEAMQRRFGACLEGRDWLSTKLALLGQRWSKAGALRIAPALHNRLLVPFARQLDRTRLQLARCTVQEADRLYAAIAGSQHFADALLMQHKLAQAARDADALNNAERNGGLAADLPASIHHYYLHFDARAEQQLRKQWREVTRRSPRNSLPTAAERIEAVEAAASAGITCASGPALALLAEADALARLATEASYTRAGLQFEPGRLLSADALTFAATEDLLRREQSARYFNDWFRPFRFWQMADYALIRDMPAGDAVQQLNVCVNEIRRLTPDRARLLNEYERLQNQIQELAVGQLVIAQRRPYQFRYLAYDGGALQPLLDDRQQQMAKLMEQLSIQEAVMGGRISLGLRLCGESNSEAGQLHRTLALVGALQGRVYKLALDTYRLEQLVQRHHAQREACFSAPIGKLEERIDAACLLLRERLKEIPCAIDARHATLDDYAAARQAATARNAGGGSAALERARALLQTLYLLNEELSAAAANLGSIAEEAYSIESIRLVAPAATP